MSILKRGEKAQKIHNHIIPNVEEMKFKEEAEKNLAGWKRAMADYENLHRRIAEENATARQRGMEDVLRSMLPVLDYFDVAFSAIPNEINKNEWVMGVSNIQKAFLDALQSQGVEQINDASAPFDPKIHEAVEHVLDNTVPSGNILAILNKGYQLNGKILRPAKVRVAENNKEEAQSLAAEEVDASDA